MSPRRAPGREIVPLLPRQSSAPPTLAPFAGLTRYPVVGRHGFQGERVEPAGLL